MVRSEIRAAVLCVVAPFALLAICIPAAAAPKRITGSLGKSGYTVIALDADGDAQAVSPTGGEFELRPPAGRVTLHLRAPEGTYGGPIVVGKEGRRAIVGVKDGARLGEVKVRNGYAKLADRLKQKWVDGSREARAKSGVPIGAGNFGHVRSRPPRPPGSVDGDIDGVPDSLDIDDDGDLVLDTVDLSPAPRARQGQRTPVPPPPRFTVVTDLTLPLEMTANANHPAPEDHIDSGLRSGGRVIFGTTGPSELDCSGDPNAVPPRGLRYCTRGGTGRIFGSEPFPECCDGGPGDPPGGDGFGTIPPFAGLPQLTHGASSDEIKTGDWLVARFNDASGAETGEQVTHLLPFVYATTPALVSYDDDGPGGEAPIPIQYPAPGEVGNPANQLPVAPCPAGALPPCVEGDIVLTLTFWRVQRSRLANDPPAGAGQSAEWTDIGHRIYTAGLGLGECGTGFSEADQHLIDRPAGVVGAAGGFFDSREPPDQPADPSQTLTFSLNVTQCLESQGFGSVFDESGEVRSLFLIAGGEGGRTDQTLVLRRE